VSLLPLQAFANSVEESNVLFFILLSRLPFICSAIRCGSDVCHPPLLAWYESIVQSCVVTNPGDALSVRQATCHAKIHILVVLRFEFSRYEVYSSSGYVLRSQAKVLVRGEQTTQKLWCKVFFTPGVMHVRRSTEQLFVQFVVLQLIPSAFSHPSVLE
jgi:hypothetical protein